MAERAPVYVGIDVGTTSTKAIAFDGTGTPLATGSSGYAVHRPAPDRAEQDAQDWIAAADASVHQVAQAVSLDTVEAIGITSQVDTHVLVDEQLQPLLPAMLWQDLRTTDHADALNSTLEAVGRQAEWESDRPVAPSNPVVRALWLAEQEPIAWNRSRWFLLPKDLVNAWLTGSPGTDPLASFPVVGADGHYVDGVSRAPGLVDRLPPLRPPESVLGRTQRTWHGIPAGTAVATGTMDAFGNVLGSGLHRPGDAMLVIGTSLIVAEIGVGGTTGQGVVDFAPYRGHQVHAGPTQSGGDSLRWWAAATGHAIDDVLTAASTAEPGAGGVVFAPHLMGERAPLWDGEVRAWFTGLHAGTGFPELSRAVLEGVAFSARELLEAVEAAAGLPAGTIVLSGGGARSPLWCQVMADVTGREMRRALVHDTAVTGAAILAAAADTGADPWDQAAVLSQHDVRFGPDPAARTRYAALFDIYRSTYQALRPVHRRLRAEQDDQ